MTGVNRSWVVQLLQFERHDNAGSAVARVVLAETAFRALSTHDSARGMQFRR